jgi:hypothetical protein
LVFANRTSDVRVAWDQYPLRGRDVWLGNDVTTEDSPSAGNHGNQL